MNDFQHTFSGRIGLDTIKLRSAHPPHLPAHGVVVSPPYFHAGSGEITSRRAQVSIGGRIEDVFRAHLSRDRFRLDVGGRGTLLTFSPAELMGSSGRNVAVVGAGQLAGVLDDVHGELEMLGVEADAHGWTLARVDAFLDLVPARPFDQVAEEMLAGRNARWKWARHEGYLRLAASKVSVVVYDKRRQLAKKGIDVQDLPGLLRVEVRMCSRRAAERWLGVATPRALCEEPGVLGLAFEGILGAAMPRLSPKVWVDRIERPVPEAAGSPEGALRALQERRQRGPLRKWLEALGVALGLTWFGSVETLRSVVRDMGFTSQDVGRFMNRVSQLLPLALPLALSLAAERRVVGQVEDPFSGCGS